MHRQKRKWRRVKHTHTNERDRDWIVVLFLYHIAKLFSVPSAFKKDVEMTMLGRLRNAKTLSIMHKYVCFAQFTWLVWILHLYAKGMCKWKREGYQIQRNRTRCSTALVKKICDCAESVNDRNGKNGRTPYKEKPRIIIQLPTKLLSNSVQTRQRTNE